MKGIFISLSGLDGAGKTTQLSLLRDEFERLVPGEVITLAGYKPRFYVEKLQKISDELGKDMNELFGSGIISYSLLCDLFKNTKEVIVPALEKGKVVLTERYYDSTIVYGPILDENMILLIDCDRHFVHTNLTLFLDIEPEEANRRVMMRAKKSGEKISEKESLDLMILARERYLEYCSQNPECIVLDVNNLDEVKIHNLIMNTIFRYLGEIKITNNGRD